MERFATVSPLSANFPTPSDSDQWLPQDFPDDLFGGTSELSQALSDDDKLFDLQSSASFPDALSELSNLQEQPNDRQVVMAAAAAAGLNRNGIRRTAFSTGDLQALSVMPSKSSPSPPDPAHASLHRTISANLVSAQPSLATVPEGSTINTGLSTGMPAMIYTSDPLVPTEDLSSMSVEELQAELIRTRQAFHSAGHASMPMYSNRQGGQPFVSQQGCFGPMARPMYPQPTGSFGDFSMSNTMTSMPAYGGGFYQDAAGNLQPLTPQTAPAVTAMEGMDPHSQQMVQSYADALLYQNDGEMGAVKQEAGSSCAEAGTSSAEAGQANQEPTCSAPQEGNLCRPTAPTAPPTSMPPVIATQQQAEARDRFIRRSQSAVELRSLGLPQHSSDLNLKELQQVTVELTTPEGHVYKVGRLSNEERAQKILKYRQKRHERNFTKRIKYMCRKTLADTRPRVRGRFARNNDAGAVMPHETKKALAAKAKAGKAAAAAQGHQMPVGMQLPGHVQPPAAQGGMGQSNPTFVPNMVPVLQARPGSSTVGQPYRGQLGANALPASSFMPIMQHQVHSTQGSVPHMSSMQPLLQNGALISNNPGQQVQFGPAMPHFPQQQAQQHQAQQQHMQQPSQFERLSTNDQTRSGYQNGLAVVSQGQCASAQSI